MAWTYFDDVLDAFVGFLPAGRRSFSSKVMWTGLKVWLGDEPKEHFEAQFHGRNGDRLEIGFHAEHREAARNEEVLAALLVAERRWRKVLGDDPVAGPFLGRQGNWRRVSEVWEGAGLLEPETAVEAAERLAQYVQALGPLLPRAPRTNPVPFSG
jgi:hypothetical protein